MWDLNSLNPWRYGNRIVIHQRQNIIALLFISFEIATFDDPNPRAHAHNQSNIQWRSSLSTKSIIGDAVIVCISRWFTLGFTDWYKQLITNDRRPLSSWQSAFAYLICLFSGPNQRERTMPWTSTKNPPNDHLLLQLCIRTFYELFLSQIRFFSLLPSLY